MDKKMKCRCGEEFYDAECFRSHNNSCNAVDLNIDRVIEILDKWNESWSYHSDNVRSKSPTQIAAEIHAEYQQEINQLKNKVIHAYAVGVADGRKEE